MTAPRRTARAARTTRPAGPPLGRHANGRSPATTLAMVVRLAAGCWADATSFEGVFVFDDD